MCETVLEDILFIVIFFKYLDDSATSVQWCQINFMNISFHRRYGMILVANHFTPEMSIWLVGAFAVIHYLSCNIIIFFSQCYRELKLGMYGDMGKPLVGPNLWYVAKPWFHILCFLCYGKCINGMYASYNNIINHWFFFWKQKHVRYARNHTMYG